MGNAVAMPALDRLLLALNVHVEAFAVCVVRRGWRLVLDPMDAPVLHYVLAGSGRLRLDDGPAVGFARHSLILVPPHRTQSIEVADGAPGRRAGWPTARPCPTGW